VRLSYRCAFAGRSTTGHLYVIPTANRGTGGTPVLVELHARPNRDASPLGRASAIQLAGVRVVPLGLSNPGVDTVSPANVSRSPPDSRRTMLCPGV
jgi:hypothetical protein